MRKMLPENKVFNIDSLRERILNYAFIDEYGELTSLPDIQSCRLVNHSWLHSTSRIFRKSRVPLFLLELGQRTGPIEDSHYLSQFVTAVTGGSRIEDRVPPFSIKAHSEFFRKENYHSFSNCLNLCGKILIDLEIVLPSDGGSMTFIFPNLHLPLLQRLSVKFGSNPLQIAEGRKKSTFGNNNNATYFIQSLLSASKHLRIINFCSSPDSRNLICKQSIPFGLEFLKLPQEITDISVSCNVKKAELEILTRNQLEKLKELELNIPCKSLSEGLIFRILKNVLETLETLVLLNNCVGCPKQITYFSFPQMKKLKTISSHGSTCELEYVKNLEENLPSLEELNLFAQTNCMFSKWTNASKFGSVKFLCVSLIAETFNLERMQSVHRAFPNLQKLNIVLREGDVSGVKYLFREMTKLEELHLRVEDADAIQDSNVWDAVMLGIPENRVPALRGHPELWDSLELKNESFPSIMNLTELRELYLNGSSSKVESLISDVVFRFAFLKMPNLLKLATGGPFFASPVTVNEWTEQGRVHEFDN